MAGSDCSVFAGNSIRVDSIAGGIAEVCFDRRADAINKFDAQTVAELAAATAAINAAQGMRGILITSAKKEFIVGADIFEFAALFALPEEKIAAHLGKQSAVFTAFADLDLPSVAAINGLALGGGFEMALTADARVMDEAGKVGLPEVSLGIFPGFGGTVRLPRVTSAATAIDWICSGKPQSASAAHAAGAVSRVVQSSQLRSAALELLESLVASGEWRVAREQRRGAFQPDDPSFGRARAGLIKAASQLPAALAAVELMKQAQGLSRDEALKLESKAFGKIARTQAAASLVQLFVNEQAVRKKGRAYARVARKVERAGVLGAGIMGGGIAYTSAARGIPVVMKDIVQNALDLGMQEANKLATRQVDAGRMTAQKRDTIVSSITPSLDYTGFESLDVVVEAVVENLAIKQTVLREAEQNSRPDAIIASNTSSLSITEMSAGLERPQNLVGMHFFNPVPIMPLVEVVRGKHTSDAAAATVASYASMMGKTPVVVRECPGFLVNRILAPYMLGFLQALHDGADYLAIDRVMENFGWPMGPAYLQDVIGMDTSVHALATIARNYEPRMALAPDNALQLLVGLGRLGQKSGAGFYSYASGAKSKPQKRVDPDTARHLEEIQPGARAQMSDAEILDRLMLPLIIEAARCLEEGIADCAAEIDLSLVLGIGFPRYAGGALKYADWLGLQRVVAACESYAHLGALYSVTEKMRSMARDGGAYY